MKKNTQGLHFWKNNYDDILLDADNLFWALSRRTGKTGTFIPKQTLELYAKFKEALDEEIEDLRFGQELTAIYIDPTDKCNAACQYCYIPDDIKQRGASLGKNELDLILKKIAAHFRLEKRKQVIIFHAAEPLLVKGLLFEAISRYKNTFKFGIQTNGLLLEKEDVDFLIKNRVGIGISLDSASRDTNNRLRPSASDAFKKVSEVLEWFNGYAGLNVITTITKHNVNHLPRMVEYLHSKKVPCVLMNPVRLTQVKARALKPDEPAMTRSFIKAVDKAMELSKKTKHKLIIGNFTNTVLSIIAPAARRLMCDISPCGGGRCFFTVTATGDIVPCGEFIGIKEFSAGNIFKTSISQAMSSKPFRKIRGRTVEKIKECADCRLRNMCGAPCPAELHSMGNMYQRSVFCEFYKSVIMHAFKMIKENKIGYLLRAASLENLKYRYNLCAER